MWLERVTFLATTIGIICGVVEANPIGVDDGDSVRGLLATELFGVSPTGGVIPYECADFKNYDFACTAEHLCDKDGVISTTGGATTSAQGPSGLREVLVGKQCKSEEQVVLEDDLLRKANCPSSQVCCRSDAQYGSIDEICLANPDKPITPVKPPAPAFCHEFETSGFECVKPEACDTSDDEGHVTITDGIDLTGVLREPVLSGSCASGGWEVPVKRAQHAPTNQTCLDAGKTKCCRQNAELYNPVCLKRPCIPEGLEISDPELHERCFAPPNSGVEGKAICMVEDDKFETCEEYAEFGFQCLPFNHCKDGTTLISPTTEQSAFSDLGLDENEFLSSTNSRGYSKCQHHASSVKKCCKLPNQEGIKTDEKLEQGKKCLDSKPPVAPPTSKPAAPATTTTTVAPPTTGKPAAPATTGKPAAPTTDKPAAPGTAAPLTKRKCGKRNPNSIVGGVAFDQTPDPKYNSVTAVFEWPHMCNLRTLDNTKNHVAVILGGASLIHESIVLTAAHIVREYVDNPENIIVQCGDFDLLSHTLALQPKMIQASKIIMHPKYNFKTSVNDVAIIHLINAFDLNPKVNPHINTICLPNGQDENNFEETDCFATGWGEPIEGLEDQGRNKNEKANELRKVPLDLVASDTCQQKLRATGEVGPIILDDSFVCAGGNSRADTCKNDGGGPLVCPAISEKSRYVQTGIVAWGVGCGGEVPAVYADVKKAMCFIDWATRCEAGPEADYYEMGDRCKNWGTHEFCKINKEIEDIDSKPWGEKKKNREKGKLTPILNQLRTAVATCNKIQESEVECEEATGVRGLD